MSSLKNFTQYIITKPEGTFDIFYYGVNLDEYSEGFIYIYESYRFKQFLRSLPFPSDVMSFTSTSNEITVFFIGSSSNNIVIVPRIREFHARNCNITNNVDIVPAPQAGLLKQASSTGNGSCSLSVVSPTVHKNDTELYALIYITIMKYNGNGSVYIVSGYNNTLFTFDEKLAKIIYKEWSIVVFNQLITIIIPPKSQLMVSYNSLVVLGKFFKQLYMEWDNNDGMTSFIKIGFEISNTFKKLI